MDIPSQYIIPYIASNIVAIIMVISAYKWFRVGRILFILLFGWAGIINTITVQNTPEVYLDYVKFAFLPVYISFIEGFFSAHLTIFVQTIAIGQLIIMLLFMLPTPYVRWGSGGAILFLVAIAPLGVGSAFPCTLIMAWAASRYLLINQAGYFWQINKKTAMTPF